MDAACDCLEQFRDRGMPDSVERNMLNTAITSSSSSRLQALVARFKKAIQAHEKKAIQAQAAAPPPPPRQRPRLGTVGRRRPAVGRRRSRGGGAAARPAAASPPPPRRRRRGSGRWGAGTQQWVDSAAPVIRAANHRRCGHTPRRRRRHSRPTAAVAGAARDVAAARVQAPSGGSAAQPGRRCGRAPRRCRRSSSSSSGRWGAGSQRWVSSAAGAAAKCNT
jgi:hypothetical protein